MSMMSCESSPKDVFEKSLDLSSGSDSSTDSISPPSPKRTKIDYSLPEYCSLGVLRTRFGCEKVHAVIKKYGMDAAPLLAEHGPNHFFQKIEYLEDIDVALELYKKTTGEDYEYVQQRSVYTLRSRAATHTNFYARRKGSGEVRLFFAEVSYDICAYRAVTCSIVRDYGPDQEIPGDGYHLTLHPADFSCPDCEMYEQWGMQSLIGEAFTDSDDD